MPPVTRTISTKARVAVTLRNEISIPIVAILIVLKKNCWLEEQSPDKPSYYRTHIIETHLEHQILPSDATD